MEATATIPKMIKITDEQRDILIQLIAAARACPDWETARALLAARDDIEKARALTNLSKSTSEQLVNIADSLLKNGSLQLEGIKAIDPIIQILRKQAGV